jgi:hypothetical protein
MITAFTNQVSGEPGPAHSSHLTKVKTNRSGYHLDKVRLRADATAERRRLQVIGDDP